MRLRRHAPALLGLVLVVAWVYAPALSGDWSFWYRDIHGFWAALSAGFVRVVRSGAWPLWTPYPSFGMPLLADPGNQALYPFTWLNLVLEQPEWYKALAVSHALLAAVGAYVLGLRLGLSRRAGFLGAALFVASGPFQSCLSHTVHFSGAAYMPWLAWAVVRALEAPAPRAALVLGGVAAVQVCAGSGDLVIMSWGIAGLLAARVLISAWLAGRPLRFMLRRLAAGAGLALLLSAGQWLPTVALLPHTARGALAPESRAYWSLHPLSVFEFLVPRALADMPLADAARSALYEGREPFWACLYLGSAALVLVAYGAGSRGSGGLLAGGLLLSGVLSLGRFTPLYALLSGLGPLAAVRYPTKYTLALALLWALLAGRGLDALSARGAAPGRAPGLAVLAVAVALAGAGLFVALADGRLEVWLADGAAAALSDLGLKLLTAAALVAGGLVLALASRRHAAALPSLLLFALADPLWVAQGINGVAPRGLVESGSRVADHVGPGSRVYVSMTRSHDWYRRQLARRPPGWRNEWAFALGRQDLIVPPLGARWDLKGSFDGDVAGFGTPLLGDLTAAMQRAEGTPLGRRLLELAGVEFVVTLDDREWPGLLPSAALESVFRNRIRVLRVPDPLPQIYLVGAARVLGETDALRTMASSDFDPRREALLGPGAEAFGAPREPFEGRATLLERRADRLVVETQASSGAVLVVLEAYAAGWGAAVDGVPAPLVPANVLFRGVAVPAGRHEVLLSYRPPGLAAGLLLSGLGLLAAAGVALSSGRSRG